MVEMTIEWSFYRHTILFPWWTAQSYLAFGISLIIIFGLALIHEWSRRRVPLLLLDRDQLGRKSLACLTIFQSLLSIALMLIVMTFNGYIIIAVVLGASLGHYRYYEDVENDYERVPLYHV